MARLPRLASNASPTPKGRKSRSTRTGRLSPISAAPGCGDGPPRHPAAGTLLARATRWRRCCPSCISMCSTMTGGVCSLLFEHNPRTGAMQATSGYGLDALPTDPWMPAPPEADSWPGVLATVADIRRGCRPTGCRSCRRGSAPRRDAAAARRGTRSASGCSRSGSPAARGRGFTADGLAPIADAFVTALELFRLRRSDELQRDLRALFDDVGGHPGGDAEPVGRARRVLSGRQPPVRRRAHRGLAPRSPRPSSGAAGLVRWRPRRDGA